MSFCAMLLRANSSLAAASSDGSLPVLPVRSERLAEPETALRTQARPERERLVGELRRLDR